MPMSQTRRRTGLSTLGFLVNITLCLIAFVKGIHFEGTEPSHPGRRARATDRGAGAAGGGRAG